MSLEASTKTLWFFALADGNQSIGCHELASWYDENE